MKIPWGLDWSPLARSLGRRRSGDGSEGGGGWGGEEEGGKSTLDATYDPSHYLTQAEQYARNLVYATILRSKAKLSAAKYRLVRSMAEEDGDSDKDDDDDDLIEKEDEDDGWFPKLSRRKSVKFGLKSFKKSFKQPLAGLLLGGRKRKCDVEPAEGFESLCEDVIQKTYELLTPLESMSIEAEDFKMASGIFKDSGKLELEFLQQSVLKEMGMQVMPVDSMDVGISFRDLISLDFMEIGSAAELENGTNSNIEALAGANSDIGVLARDSPAIEGMEVEEVGGPDEMEIESPREMDVEGIPTKEGKTDEQLMEATGIHVPPVQKIAIESWSFKNFPLRPHPRKSEEQIASQEKLLANLMPLITEGKENVNGDYAKPKPMLTIPRSQKQWQVASFDDPTPVLEPEKIFVTEEPIELQRPKSELDENDNIRPGKMEGEVMPGKCDGTEELERKWVIEENLKNRKYLETGSIPQATSIPQTPSIPQTASIPQSILQTPSISQTPSIPQTTSVPQIASVSQTTDIPQASVMEKNYDLPDIKKPMKRSASSHSFRKSGSLHKKLKRELSVDLYSGPPLKIGLRPEELRDESVLMSSEVSPHEIQITVDETAIESTEISEECKTGLQEICKTLDETAVEGIEISKVSEICPKEVQITLDEATIESTEILKEHKDKISPQEICETLDETLVESTEISKVYEICLKEIQETVDQTEILKEYKISSQEICKTLDENAIDSVEISKHEISSEEVQKTVNKTDMDEIQLPFETLDENAIDSVKISKEHETSPQEVQKIVNKTDMDELPFDKTQQPKQNIYQDTNKSVSDCTENPPIIKPEKVLKTERVAGTTSKPPLKKRKAVIISAVEDAEGIVGASGKRLKTEAVKISEASPQSLQKKRKALDVFASPSEIKEEQSEGLNLHKLKIEVIKTPEAESQSLQKNYEVLKILTSPTEAQKELSEGLDLQKTDETSTEILSSSAKNPENCLVLKSSLKLTQNYPSKKSELSVFIHNFEDPTKIVLQLPIYFCPLLPSLKGKRGVEGSVWEEESVLSFWPPNKRRKEENKRSGQINEIAKLPIPRHLDAFEFYRAEDEREWARRYEEVHVDTKSASAMFKLLQAKLQYSAAYPHFLSLLHHLLLLPTEVSTPDAWILYDRVVQQLVTQKPTGDDREVPLLDINVSEIVKLIANERELTESRRKISKLEAEFADVVTDLNSKEQQLYAVTQEKEDLTQTLGQVRGQLESEVRACQEAVERSSQLEAKVETLTTQLREVAAGCVSDDVKATIAKDASDGLKGVPPPPPPPMMNGIPPPPPPMMNGAPPPPPPMMGAPPPPPPMMGGPPPPPMMNGGPPPPPNSNKQARPSKQVPRSANQLRAFNWAKMPDSRVNGTIFAALDESPLYKFMDLEDIDRTFDASAGRKAGGEGEKTLERIKSQRTHQVSVLENRRQQNCTILLSKLKMNNDELVKVLLKMDSDGELQPDMVEQLLKFTPTVEEKVMLEEHQDEIEVMARADRFLLQISKIEHYEERLKCLLYQKKYKERLGECEPSMAAVSTATRELTNSKRLKKFIEIVLAFGNYMNKGARGGAYGFRVSSLNKLTDTKASSNRAITLLHYILRLCEKQWRDVLRLDEDFPSLKEAAKVNITELEKEMCGLREGLAFIEREVTWHRSQGSPPPGDRFRLAMNEFSALARDKFTNLEAQFTLMKSQYESICKLFGEDPKTTQPEDFFGHFDSFIDTFRDTKRDLENMRRKEEEEERKKKEAERREVERERRARERSTRMQAGGAGGPGGAGGAGGGGAGGGDSSSGGENENDFDDLISALRSGDVFGKDIDKMRRKKKQSFSGSTRESNRDRVTGSHKYA